MVGRWLASVSSGAAVLLLSRWLFHIGRPAQDGRRVAAFLARPCMALRDAWRSLWRYYGPVTRDMLAGWERLRQRYHGGFYGLEGT